MYNTSSRHEQGTYEKRRASDRSLKTIQNQEEREMRFSRIASKQRQSIRLMSFELEGDFKDSIQNQTREFDPGSGRTLAACLTHASRARRRKLASES